MTAPLIRAFSRPSGWSNCLRSFANTSSSPSRFLHSSATQIPFKPQAATAEAAASASADSSSQPSAASSSSNSSLPSIRPSQWYPGNPLELPPSARRSLRRRLRNADPSRPHLSAFAHLDNSTTPPTLRYTFPPRDAKPRKYQLNIPQPHTTFAFRITHAAKEYIQQASEVFEEQALKLNLQLDSIVPLPTRTKRWTLLRSPHVDKHSREQLELKRHKRLITITANTPPQQQQIVKLLNRTTGMASDRVTMTYRIPAGVAVESMTFRSEDGERLLDAEGVRSEAARRTVAGWEEDDEWEVDGYEMEDEVELTEEEDNWGEDLDLDEEVEDARPGRKV